MSKTFHVVPTTNNSSGQYQITLYFTAAEKAGWEAVTGNSWNNIKLIKVKSQISNYSPSTPYPDGLNGFEIITPTPGTLGNNYTLTATFSSGFSGLGAGIPAFTTLPVNLLSFAGHVSNTSAILQWSTSSEQNAKDFDIEKSADGMHYYKIGTVNAKGNSGIINNYIFTDKELNTINYYRLRMNDLNGKNELSKIVVIRYDNARQNVWVVNNPFESYIDLRFSEAGMQVKLQLINTMGAVVTEKSIRSSSGQLRWNLPSNLARGSYVLKAIADGKQFISKVIKQ